MVPLFARDPPVRDAVQPRRPSRAGPHRRPRDLGRGGRAGHPGDQGVRPAPADAAVVHPRRRPTADRGAHEDPHPRPVLGPARGPPADHAGRGHAGGVYAAAHGAITIGELVAFVALYLQLVWPIIMLGWLLALTEEAASACRRIFEVLDTEPTIIDPPSRWRPKRAPPSCSRTSASATTTRASEVLRGVDLELRAGRDDGAGRRGRARARRRSPRSSRGSTTSPAAAC